MNSLFLSTIIKIRHICTILFISFLCFSNAFCISNSDETACIEKLWADVKNINSDKRPHIALVLGGGGARGLAHIGVLRILQDEGIPIDSIVGTSIGAVVGAFYATGISTYKIEQMAHNISWRDMTQTSLFHVLNLLFFERLLKTEKMHKYLTKHLGNKRFDELSIPFACVATDIQTGERIILRQGHVADAVRASVSLPGIFKPTEYKQRFLVDGGVVNNIPVDVAKILGGDIVIAVNVEANFTKRQISSIYQTLLQIMTIQGNLLNKNILKDADIILTPNVGDVGIMELTESKKCIHAGIIESRKKMTEIKQALILKFISLK